MQTKADNARPDMEDHLMRSNLTAMERRQRAFDTGTAFQRERDELMKGALSASQNVLRMSGGSVGTAIQGSSTARQPYLQALIGLAKTGREQATALGKDITTQANLMAHRKFDLGMLMNRELTANAAQLKTDSKRNIMPFIAAVGDTGAGALGSAMDGQGIKDMTAGLGKT
jgi:hypothetical protein